MLRTVYVEEGAKPIAWVVKIETNTSFVLDPTQSIFTRDARARMFAEQLVKDCTLNKTPKCVVTIVPMYRDKKVGRLLPGRGIPNKTIGYTVLSR